MKKGEVQVAATVAYHAAIFIDSAVGDPDVVALVARLAEKD